MQVAEILLAIDDLIARVHKESEDTLQTWGKRGDLGAFADSAHNLACYLALRHEDLRPLQRSLMALGLSSLGRLESRVMQALQAVRAALAAIAEGGRSSDRPSETDFFAGERRLAERAKAFVGCANARRPVALLVTCPTEAAEDPSFLRGLAERQVEAIRINCAHDNAKAWRAMIAHARAAEAATGHRLRIFMDLAGPKIRTAKICTPDGEPRIRTGDRIAIVRCGALSSVPHGAAEFAAECTLAEAVDAARANERFAYDDGKFSGTLVETHDWGLLGCVDHGPDKGVKLKSGKGLNFPDTDLGVAALTDKDRRDLAVVTEHADGIGFSFVQSAGDVRLLQEALAEARDDWRDVALILKIETTSAVSNLPEIMVQAASRQPTAIMIARGDLAVEIGFARMAEMQEEILWLSEAAQLPVIWATQVLEHLVKKGTPSRGEMTDAAMAARAECVMLNKGPYMLEAIDTLDTLLARMDDHQHKKTPQLRRLRSW